MRLVGVCCGCCQCWETVHGGLAPLACAGCGQAFDGRSPVAYVYEVTIAIEVVGLEKGEVVRAVDFAGICWDVAVRETIRAAVCDARRDG
jgi:hypothetical protein